MCPIGRGGLDTCDDFAAGQDQHEEDPEGLFGNTEVKPTASASIFANSLAFGSRKKNGPPS
jgi:hypothetical protein